MKFKRIIASILAATFSLTLIGQSVPKAFAEEISKTITEEKLDSNPPEKTPQEETPQKEATQKETAKEKASPNDQVTLDELKEKIKKIENEVTDLKKESGWSFKKGIQAIKKALPAFVIGFIGMASINAFADTLASLEQLQRQGLDNTKEYSFGKVLLTNIKYKKTTYLKNAFFNITGPIFIQFISAS